MATKHTNHQDTAPQTTAARRMLKGVGVGALFVAISAAGFFATIYVISRSNAVKEETAVSQRFTSEDATKNFANIGTGAWTIENGKALVLVQNIASQSNASASGLTAATAHSMTINQTPISAAEWRFEVEATAMRSTDTPANVSLVFEYIDSNNFYYANFSEQKKAGLHGFYQVKSSVITKLADFPDTITAGKPYEFEIRKKSNQVRAYINSSYQAKSDDTQTGIMKIGIGAIDSNARFMNIALKIGGVTTNPVFVTPTTGTPTPTPTPTPAPSPAPTPAPISNPVGGLRNVTVKTSAELTAALSDALPGDIITMADGTYTGKISLNGIGASFGASTAGTANAPITLRGSRSAVINGGSTSGGYGLYLSGANYWNVSGFTITNAGKGLVADRTNRTIIDGLRIYNIGVEALHLRAFSSDNVLRNNIISDTGIEKPQYGEGIYIGSAKSNWKTYSNGNADTSDRNQIIGNTVSSTGAESLDIKEGSSYGIVSNNSFNGAGMSGDNYADSLIDVKGNNYTITNNTGINALLDAYQVHSVLNGWGYNNSFKGNTLDVRAPGYGFNVQSSAKGNIVYCDNTITNAAKGFANVICVN